MEIESIARQWVDVEIYIVCEVVRTWWNTQKMLENANQLVE